MMLVAKIKAASPTGLRASTDTWMEIIYMMMNVQFNQNIALKEREP